MEMHPLHRLRPGLIVVVSTLALALWPLKGLSQGSDEVLKQRFLREAPPQWEEYARLSGELQGRIALTDKNTDLQDDVHLEYKTNGRATVLQTAGKRSGLGKVEQVEAVFGFNPRYAF